MQVNRDQIREIVKEEFYKILFEEKIFETEIKAYIKSLVYDDVHYLRLLNSGVVKHGRQIFELPKYSSGKLIMHRRANITLENIYNENIRYNIMAGDLSDFIAVINFESESGIIDWRQKGRKQFTYTGIFKMYEEIYDIEFKTMEEYFVDMFMSYLSTKFQLGGNFKKWTDFKKSFMKIYQPEKKS